MGGGGGCQTYEYDTDTDTDYNRRDFILQEYNSWVSVGCAPWRAHPQQPLLAVASLCFSMFADKNVWNSNTVK